MAIILSPFLIYGILKASQKKSKIHYIKILRGETGVNKIHYSCLVNLLFNKLPSYNLITLH